MRREVGLLMAAFAAWANPLHAETAAPPQAAALSWLRLPGGERCPVVKDIAGRIDQHLRRRAFVEPAAAQLFIEASIGPADGQRFAVKITLSDETGKVLGTRELTDQGPECASAADSAALVIALMLDPDALARSSEAAFESPLPAPPPPAPAPAAIVSPPLLNTPPTPRRPATRVASEKAPKRQPWRARVALGALAEIGALPGFAPGVVGGVRLSPSSRHAGIEVTGAYLPPKAADVRADAGGSMGANLVGFAGWLAPWQRGAWTLSVVLGARVGAVTAKGFGFTGANRYQSAWALEGAAELELAWEMFESFSLVVRPGVAVPFRRDRFEATVAGEKNLIFRASPVIGLLSVGVGFGP